jgi:hypothetical protein
MAEKAGNAEKARFDAQNLYREEVYSDLSVGSIRQMTPVTPDGKADATRPLLFVGQAQVYTPQGPMPVQFPIEAGDLRQAMERFAEAMEAFVARLVEEARELQRQEQSRLIVPGSAAGKSNIIL